MRQENHCGNSCGMRNFAVRVASLSVSTPTQQGFQYAKPLSLLNNASKKLHKTTFVKCKDAASRMQTELPSTIPRDAIVPSETNSLHRQSYNFQNVSWLFNCYFQLLGLDLKIRELGLQLTSGLYSFLRS
jgi:hypothetical protein